MMPDLSGLAYLAVVGIATVILAAVAVPIAVAWGLAWLVELRAGPTVWTVWAGFSWVWALAVSAFVGTALFGRR